MLEATTRLESQVEALIDLTVRALGRLRFLQPMLDNRQLHECIERESKVAGFERLRSWLYWGLVLELTKLCSDKNERVPSIAGVTKKLADNPSIVQALEDKYEKNNREMGSTDQLRAEFRRIYARFSERAERTLSDRVAGSYRIIRNKLIAHNELLKNDQFHDVKVEKLKYGDERALLKNIQELVDDLSLLVRNVDIQSIWSESFSYDWQMTCEFWGIDYSDEATEP